MKDLVLFQQIFPPDTCQLQLTGEGYVMQLKAEQKATL